MNADLENRVSRGRPVVLVLALLVGCAHSGAERAPDMPGMRKDLARQLIQRGAWRDAVEILNALQREQPRDAEVLTLRGIVFRDQGLLEEAESDLERAIELSPANAHAHSALGIVLEHAGQPDRALERHRRAAELEPDNGAYLSNLGFSLYVHGRAREAIAWYEKALRHDPLNRRIRNNLGFALARVGDFRQAAAQFDRGGAPHEARNNLGYAYELAGNFGQAMKIYLEAARLEPTPGRARRNLVRLADRLGRDLPADLSGLPAAPKNESEREGEAK